MHVTCCKLLPLCSELAISWHHLAGKFLDRVWPPRSMDRRAAPAPLHRLAVLYLQDQTQVRGWRSIILREPRITVLEAILGATAPGAVLLLALRPAEFSALRCLSRGFHRVFIFLADAVFVLRHRLRRRLLA